MSLTGFPHTEKLCEESLPLNCPLTAWQPRKGRLGVRLDFFSFFLILFLKTIVLVWVQSNLYSLWLNAGFSHQQKCLFFVLGCAPFCLLP